MAAPFHAIGVLRPGLQSTGYARSAIGDSGLDTIRGITSSGTTDPVLWPGNGASTQLSSFTGELPDPLESCGWSRSGLPLIALLPDPHKLGTTATLTDELGLRHRVCVITADTFRATDKIYGETGRSILRGDNAVLIRTFGTVENGSLMVYPCGQTVPTTPTAALKKGRSVATTITTTAGALGDICLHTTTATRLTWVSEPVGDMVFDSRRDQRRR